MSKIVAASMLLCLPAHAADIAISALPAASSVSGADIVPIVQSGTTKKATFTVQQNLWSSLFQPIDGDLTALAALTGTHTIYYRSAASTWTAVTIGSGLDFTGATLSAPGTGLAPSNAHYVTTQAESGLSNEFNLGGLTTGLIYQTVSGSVSTPAIASITSPLSFTTGTLSVTGSALTKTDDTNVTLTLGGAPTTALLGATSLTLGWTGTLPISRGGWGKAMTDPNADRLTIWDDTDGDFQFVTVGTGLSYTHATHTLAATATAQSHAITFVVDGAGSVLTTGTKNPVKIPYGGTLVGWLLIAKPSGSVTVDILRAADGAGLPVTSIIGGGGTKPAVSSAVENSSTSFTSWTSTTLTAKDNLAISLSGIATSTYCALTVYYQ